jgi:hypothetical protein
MDLSKIDTNNLGGWSMSYEMLLDILKYVPEGGTILEFGSGNGTNELLKYYNVISVEHDINYVGYVTGSKYIYAPIGDMPHTIKGFRHIKQWYNIDKIQEGLKDRKYDCIIIDGPHGSWKKGQGRPGILCYVNQFNMNVPIFVDDVVRPNNPKHGDDEMKLAKELSTLFNKKIILKDKYAILLNQ